MRSDRWLDHTPLMELFLDLYAIISDKKLNVINTPQGDENFIQKKELA